MNLSPPRVSKREHLTRMMVEHQQNFIRIINALARGESLSYGDIHLMQNYKHQSKQIADFIQRHDKNLPPHRPSKRQRTHTDNSFFS